MSDSHVTRDYQYVTSTIFYIGPLFYNIFHKKNKYLAF